MKILIISDIHGSSYYARKMLEIIKKENPEKIIILGDLYYHGPRNQFPEDYNPMEVAAILNSLKENLIVLKGNCDAEVDEMISDFKFQEEVFTEFNGYKVYLTHGHKYNKDNLPKEEFDIMFYGHLHTGFIIEQNNKIFANPGSISLPKNNTEHSYIIFEENTILLKDEKGNVIEEKII